MSGLRGTDPLRAWTKTAGWGLSLRRRCGAAGVVILFGATVSDVAVMQCGGCGCLVCGGQTQSCSAQILPMAGQFQGGKN